MRLVLTNAIYLKENGQVNSRRAKPGRVRSGWPRQVSRCIHDDSETEVRKSITSSIIELKLSDVIKRTQKSNEERNLFQKVVLSEAKIIREAINEGKKEFREILPLLEKSKKFKHWLHQKDDNVSIIKEYYQSISDKSWIQKLPSKLLKFSLFTGAGIFADTFVTGGLGTVLGVTSGSADNFIVENLAKGWKPDQYIDELTKFVE